MNRGAAALVGGALVLAVAFGTVALVRGQRPAPVPPALLGTLREVPRELPAFTLTDQRGAAFGLERLRGAWTLVFLGYASCPDVCPTTMAMLGQLMAELRRRGAPLPQVVLVSVDPARDGLDQLGRYVAHFDPGFVGVTGPDDQLRALALPLGAMYERGTPDAHGQYEVAHSGSVFVIDPAARVHAAFAPPHQPSVIADQLALIRARHDGG